MLKFVRRNPIRFIAIGAAIHLAVVLLIGCQAEFYQRVINPPISQQAAPPAAVTIPKYSRRQWRHWVDEDRDCQKTRDEVLIAESLKPVTFKTEKRCKVETGFWICPYTGKTFTNPRKLDVDHMVPLGNAHASGGWRWDRATKRRYANHLGASEHLIAVSASANRAKGARGPDAWKPPSLAYWCQYAIDWKSIKYEWGLRMTPAEEAAVETMLKTCRLIAL